MQKYEEEELNYHVSDCIVDTYMYAHTVILYPHRAPHTHTCKLIYTVRGSAYVLHPIHTTPCTLYTLHPAPYTLYTPYTLHALHPTPYTLHPTP